MPWAKAVPPQASRSATSVIREGSEFMMCPSRGQSTEGAPLIRTVSLKRNENPACDGRGKTIRWTLVVKGSLVQDDGFFQDPDLGGEEECDHRRMIVAPDQRY